jgi:aspartyl-tRNA synthetase
MTTLEEEAQKMGAKFLLYHRGTEVGDQIKSKSSFRKMSPASLTHLLKAADMSKDDLLLVCASSRRWVANWALGKVRLLCAEHQQKRNLLRIPPDRFDFLWVVDFPLYDVDFDNSNHLVTNHHPFTAPLPEDIPLLDTKPELVRGLHYDIVLNGVEIGGGSIRIHNHALQLKVLRDNLKLSHELISRFTHLLDALRYGCPPHGGLALGFDRLVALACGAPTLKDVIAFPKSASGNELMTKSPGALSATELALYGLKLLNDNPADIKKK